MSGSVVAWRGGAAISHAEFMRDVRIVAANLPAGDAVMNRCVSRYAFAVLFMAVAQRRRKNLLPGSTAPAVLGQLANRYAGPPSLDDGGIASLLGARGADGRAAEALGAAIGVPATSAADTTPDPSAIVAVAFTSGSTGEPQPHAKSWLALSSTARAIVAQLGEGRALNVVATVPPQHMYGLEASVMVALVAGCAFHDGAAFHPDEVRNALRALPRPRLLVTTPFHLRHLLASRPREDEVRIDVVLSATAPLSRELADAAEKQFGSVLHEIYGCTEAGTIAMRRTTRDELWLPMPEVTVEEFDGRARVLAAYLPEPVVLADRLQVAADGRFALSGRDADLIKVAGKRASLADLTRKLAAIEGVLDAVVFMPDEQPHTRPAALAVAPGLREDTLRARLRGELDSAFVPRPLRIVDALPRNALGKLPREELLRLLEEEPAEQRRSAIVESSHPAIAGHFPGHPLVPGVMILAMVADAVLGDATRARLVRTVKFHRPLRPDEPLEIVWSVRDGTARFRCERSGELIADGRISTT